MDTRSKEYWEGRAAKATDKERLGWLDAQYDFDEQTHKISAIVRGLLWSRGCEERRILDIGCGNGRFADCTLGIKATWTGIDFCEDFRRQFDAKRLPPEKAKFILGQAENIANEAGLGTFDLIIGVGVIGLLGFTTETFCEAFGHLLKDGGAFVLDAGPRQARVIWKQ